MSGTVQRFHKIVLCLLLPILGGTSPLLAGSYILMSDEELVEQATLIVEVEVLHKGLGVFEDAPSTEYTCLVARTFKGTARGSRLLVRVRGGAGPDGRTLLVLGSPAFEVGARALLFLKPNRDRSFSILHSRLGVFELEERDGITVAFRTLDGVQVYARPVFQASDPPVEKPWAKLPPRGPSRGGGRSEPPAAAAADIDAPAEMELTARETVLADSLVASLPAFEWSLRRDYEKFAGWLEARVWGSERPDDYYLPISASELVATAHAESSPLAIRWFLWDKPATCVHVKWQQDCTGGKRCKEAAFPTAAAIDHWKVGSIQYRLEKDKIYRGRDSLSEIDANLAGDPSCSGEGSHVELEVITAVPGFFDGTLYFRIQSADLIVKNTFTCLDENSRKQALIKHFGETLGLGLTENKELAKDRYPGTCS